MSRRLTEFSYRNSYSFGRSISKHIAVAEKALGKVLPKGCIVHHADGNCLDDSPENLVICPNEAYHNLLHRRLRAFEACGDPSKEKCQYCGEWSEPSTMQSARKNDRPSVTFWHAVCRSKYRKGFLARKGYTI